MKLTYLGSGNAFVPQRDWSCILVNDTILLDAPPTVLGNMKRLNLDPTQLRHIFISHFHGDHFFGLPFLLLEYHFNSRTDEPLAMIGPPGIEEIVRQVMTLAYPDVAQFGWPRPVSFTEVRAGEIHTVDGLSFSAVPVPHVPFPQEAFGYRLHLDDGILAYSGDTEMSDALFALIADANAVILEASAQEVSPIHLGRQALRQILQRLPAHCPVFLNHLDTPDATAWQDLPVIVPDDLHSYLIHFTSSAQPEVTYV
ncbi:MAG: MBL fold metallo-hydrolase [Armatimonadota bacterium]